MARKQWFYSGHRVWLTGDQWARLVGWIAVKGDPQVARELRQRLPVGYSSDPRQIPLTFEEGDPLFPQLLPHAPYLRQYR
jgi:hypothetical protein